MTFLYDFLTIIKFSFGKILPSLWGSVNHLRIKNCCTARFSSSRHSSVCVVYSVIPSSTTRLSSIDSASFDDIHYPVSHQIQLVNIVCRFHFDNLYHKIITENQFHINNLIIFFSQRIYQSIIRINLYRQKTVLIPKPLVPKYPLYSFESYCSNLCISSS